MTKLGTVVGGMQLQDPRTKQQFFSLDLVDLDAPPPADKPRRVPMKFLAHGFTVDPTRNHVAAIFEKKGPGACVVDLAVGAVLRDVAPRDARSHFYGHGQYSNDGAVVYCVETDLDSRRGFITIRDGKDFRVLDELPTFGQNPHDCVLLPGSVMLVTNGGGPLGTTDRGCVTVLDLQAKKLLERVDVADEHINAGHLSVQDAHNFAVSSAPRDGLPEKQAPGAISFRNEGRALARALEPRDVAAKMLGESLSVAVHPRTGIAVVTNPWGNLLTIWEAKSSRLIEARPMEFPRGVTLTLDDEYFVITHGARARVSLFDTNEVKSVADRAEGTISGSHVYAWDSGNAAGTRSGSESRATSAD